MRPNFYRPISFLSFYISPFCPWPTWSTLETRYLPVCLLWNALVIHPYYMAKPAQSSFTENVRYALLTSSDPDFLLCYPVFSGDAQYAFFAICDRQHPVVSLVLLLAAVALHCTGEWIGRLTRTTVSLVLSLSCYFSRFFSPDFFLSSENCCCFYNAHLVILFAASIV